MLPGVSPACWAMRGMVAPSTPCWPRTSAAALINLRSDSRLRTCCGSKLLPVFALAMAMTLPKNLLDRIPSGNVNVNSHLHKRRFTMSTAAIANASALPAPERRPHPLRQRNFLMWWLGATISLAGDQFYIVALPWVVLQLTGSGLAMGTVAMAAGIPRAVLMLMGGAVSDRSSPRRLLMATATARTLLVAAIGVLLWRQHLQLWHLYLLATGFGIADAFALPTASSLMRTLVPIEQLPAANSVWQSSALLTSIMGPAPAGLLMKKLGVAWAFFLDAFSFLFIIAALWRLPDTPPAPRAQRGSVWTSIGEGLKYVGHDVALRSLMLLTAVLNFCLAGPLSVGLAYMAKQRFS